MARLGGSGLKETLVNLPKCSYYFGAITTEEAEVILAEEPDGSFLIRDTIDPSSRYCDTYTLTFKSQGKFGSIRVDFSKGFFSLCLGHTAMPMFRTMPMLVEDAVETSRRGDAVCVLGGHLAHQDVSLFLTNAVKRTPKPHSLGHICRNVLYQKYARHELDAVPLPVHLKEYLKSSPYYDPSLYTVKPETAVSGQPTPTSPPDTKSGAPGSLY